jgi:hypothetical protein
MKKEKILFLGETYRADAILDGWPQRIGGFEIVT